MEKDLKKEEQGKGWDGMASCQIQQLLSLKRAIFAHNNNNKTLDI